MNSNKDSEWKVWRVNECDWWLGRTLEEVHDAMREALECEGIDVDRDNPPVPLLPHQLEQETFTDEDYEPMEPHQWVCESCGERCSVRDRWTGTRWEHSHGGQIGHMPAKNIHRRTFAEELARRIKAGPNAELFGSTEH